MKQGIVILSDFRQDQSVLRIIRKEICNYVGLRFIENPSDVDEDNTNNPIIGYTCSLTEKEKQEIHNIISRYGEETCVFFLTLKESTDKDYLNVINTL
jgi:hypothetical protein